MTTVPSVDVDPIDLSDLAFWAEPVERRETVFRALCHERPIAPA